MMGHSLQLPTSNLSGEVTLTAVSNRSLTGFCSKYNANVNVIVEKFGLHRTIQVYLKPSRVDQTQYDPSLVATDALWNPLLT